VLIVLIFIVHETFPFVHVGKAMKIMNIGHLWIALLCIKGHRPMHFRGMYMKLSKKDLGSFSKKGESMHLQSR
jgi:hypothetical protein